jgi:hypothetical protein
MGVCLEKRLKLWPEKSSLHNSNASMHDALRVLEFQAKKLIQK